jgi:hypothetical protein
VPQEFFLGERPIITRVYDRFICRETKTVKRVTGWTSPIGAGLGHIKSTVSHHIILAAENIVPINGARSGPGSGPGERAGFIDRSRCGCETVLGITGVWSRTLTRFLLQNSVDCDYLPRLDRYTEELWK